MNEINLPEKPVLSVGLMSGTSADGLTIALCEIKDRRIITKAFKTYDYSQKLREKIISAKDMRASELSELNFELGRLWAGMTESFFKEIGLSYKDVECIASHGQTVWHEPNGLRHTLQIGEASFISELTGIPVICDFRPRDIAAGGEGAPLVPFLDDFLYGNSELPVALQNIGGIGNIAFAGKGIDAYGFDTGPGNSLMDTAISIYTNGRQGYDKDGYYASHGKADMRKVESLLKSEYFSRKPPKSLDRSSFAIDFLKKHFQAMSEKNICDVMATLNMFTAAAIADAFRRFAPKNTYKIIVSGGGALNKVLMKNIRDLMPSGVKTVSSEAEGMHPLAKEAACFALMGLLAIRGKINHCPNATGASGKRILGKIIPGMR